MLPDSLEIAILMYKSPQICILKTTAEEVTKASDDNTVRVKISRGCSMHRGPITYKKPSNHDYCYTIVNTGIQKFQNWGEKPWAREHVIVNSFINNKDFPHL